MKEMCYLYEQMLWLQNEECQPAIHPELSSLIDYPNKYNYSTIYGLASNFIFLWNIISSQSPPSLVIGIHKVLENGARPNLDILHLGFLLPYYFSY